MAGPRPGVQSRGPPAPHDRPAHAGGSWRTLRGRCFSPARAHAPPATSNTEARGARGTAPPNGAPCAAGASDRRARMLRGRRPPSEASRSREERRRRRHRSGRVLSVPAVGVGGGSRGYNSEPNEGRGGREANNRLWLAKAAQGLGTVCIGQELGITALRSGAYERCLASGVAKARPRRSYKSHCLDLVVVGPPSLQTGAASGAAHLHWASRGGQLAEPAPQRLRPAPVRPPSSGSVGRCSSFCCSSCGHHF